MDIELLRNICLQHPAVTDEEKWGADLVFSVGGKMFCVADPEGATAFSVKVPPDAFEEYCARPGIIPAPYLARAGWVKFLDPHMLTKGELQGLIGESYRLVAAKLTKKQKAELGLF